MKRIRFLEKAFHMERAGGQTNLHAPSVGPFADHEVLASARKEDTRQRTAPRLRRASLSRLVSVDEEVAGLHVEDAGRAVTWYERLGFPGASVRARPPVIMSVARGNVRLYLSEHKGDARPNTLIHLYVKDIDAVSLEFGTLSTKRVLLGGSATWKIRTATGCV